MAAHRPLLVALLLVGRASAAAPDHARPAWDAPDLHPSDFNGSVPSPPLVVLTPRRFIGPGGPEVWTPETRLAAASRVRSIETLTALLKDTICLGGMDPAVLLLRLATLYFEEGEYQVALAGEGDPAAATYWLDKAVRLYGQILTYYPRSSGLDEARFNLGYALLLRRDAAGARAEWTRLLQTYPDSPLVRGVRRPGRPLPGAERDVQEPVGLPQSGCGPRRQALAVGLLPNGLVPLRRR